MRHDELANDLAGFLAGNSDRMLWCNVQLGPSGSVRPDVYSLAKSFVKPSPRAYEVKASRADFLADVGAGKWLAYLDFAECVYFAAPKGLIAPGDLPAEAGLIQRGDGWRVARAPKPRRVDVPADALMKLLIEGESRRYGSGSQRRYFHEGNALRKVEAKWGQRTARIIADLDAAEIRIESARTEAERTGKRAADEAASLRADAIRHLEPILNVIGVEAGARPWDIIHGIQRAAERLSRDEEIARLRRIVERVRTAVEDASAPPEQGRGAE